MRRHGISFWSCVYDHPLCRQQEMEFAKEMGVALYKVRDTYKVAADLNEIAKALIEAATMPSAPALRTIVRSLAVQIVDAATRVEGIKDIVDEVMSMPNPEGTE